MTGDNPGQRDAMTIVLWLLLAAGSEGGAWPEVREEFEHGEEMHKWYADYGTYIVTILSDRMVMKTRRQHVDTRNVCGLFTNI